jgi:hypothetical protein
LCRSIACRVRGRIGNMTEDRDGRPILRTVRALGDHDAREIVPVHQDLQVHPRPDRINRGRCAGYVIVRPRPELFLDLPSTGDAIPLEDVALLSRRVRKENEPEYGLATDRTHLEITLARVDGECRREDRRVQGQIGCVHIDVDGRPFLEHAVVHGPIGGGHRPLDPVAVVIAIVGDTSRRTVSIEEVHLDGTGRCTRHAGRRG